MVSWPSRAAAIETDTIKNDVETVEAQDDAPTSVTVPASSTTLPALDVGETVLLQAFGWHSSRVGDWYNIVRNIVPDIKAAGFTHVWLPPPSQSVSREGYLPSDLYNLDTPYGSKSELTALCTALKDVGVRPVADIVINHRSAGAQGPDGRWNQFTYECRHPIITYYIVLYHAVHNVLPYQHAYHHLACRLNLTEHAVCALSSAAACSLDLPCTPLYLST